MKVRVASQKANDYRIGSASSFFKIADLVHV